jgi:copper homeostasis protein CutC
MGGLKLRSLRAFETTVTEEKAIAPAAKIGFRRIPKKGKRTPAATGMRIVL